MLVRSVRRENEIPFDLQNQSKMWSEEFLNVVKNYTLGVLLPIIYIGALERVLFFHQCAAQDPCDRRTRALLFICCKSQQVKVRFVVQGYKKDYRSQNQG